ncbi:putative uncharacterized protein MYH16 [Perca fluviatilis]|uniref:putative uncharacterized protein MYH16 n=1 Tax=Perca fluviatilis TaxID=8168 RepID=UPI00196422B3|nr:putative uncharacterized protein MYH16 [Perca fluviatilis]
MAEAAVQVGEELCLEQEQTVHLERVKKGLEAQVRDMSSRLDQAEQMALKGGKKIIQKLEGKVKELELDSDHKWHIETVKTLQNERQLKELLFESEEEQKNQQRMQGLVERLQNKMRRQYVTQSPFLFYLFIARQNTKKKHHTVRRNKLP